MQTNQRLLPLLVAAAPSAVSAQTASFVSTIGEGVMRRSTFVDTFKEDRMSTRRFVFAVIVIAMGTLQAWDSRVFGAPAIVVALATMGILAPAAALLTRDARIRLGAIILSALVLLAARMLSPHPLQTLHLVTLIGALVMFADWRMSNPVEPRG